MSDSIHEEDGARLIRQLQTKLRYATSCLREAEKMTERYHFDNEERELLGHTLNEVAGALSQVHWAIEGGKLVQP